MTSEPNTNIGSTSTNQSTYIKPKEQEELKKKEVSTGHLFAYMTKSQAENAGVLDLFQKYDVNNNGEIDTKEYINYKTGADPNVTFTKRTQEEQQEFFNNLTPEEFKDYIRKGFSHMGIDDDIAKSIIEMQNNEKKDINQITKEYLGVDLSKYSTKEEKQAAFEKAFNKKFAFPSSEDAINKVQELIDSGEIDKIDNNSSIYLQQIKRLRNGEFDNSELEKELKGQDPKQLTAKQLDKYARAGARRDEIVKLSKYFAESDDAGKKLLINNISNLETGVQTGIIGAAVLSANDNETRMMYAELLKDQDLKLTSKFNKKVFEMAVKTMQTNLSSEASIEFTTDKNKFETKEDALDAYKMYDASEQYKRDKGIITDEEYQSNYVNLYAANAYKVDLAAEAYKYVIDHSSEANRADTMNMLASNAYQIKDDSQRNGAISNIKNSGYYNDNVQENLDKSYAKKLESTYSNTNSTASVQVKSYQNQTNPINNDYYQQVINTTIENGDDSVIEELVTKSFEDINQKGQTNKQKKLGMQRGMAILTKLISNNKIQNSSYEGIVLKKLSALPAPTLLNMFLSSNEKVQGYFYKNNLISPLTIAMNAGHSEIEQLPDIIKDKVMAFKDEHYDKNKS